MNTYLGNKGYSIYKSGLTQKQLEKIRRDLTVVPFSPIQLGGQSTVKYPVYAESPTKVYVPYFYGLREFGRPMRQVPAVSLVEQIPVERVKWYGPALRDNQVPVVDKYLTTVRDPMNAPKAGGILELHTGFGKTLCAIWLIAQLRVKTAIIVHKEFLLNQWLENFAAYVPHVKIGRIQGEIMDVADKDVVICMLQSISMKEYPESTFNTFGLLIVDEMHHISSEVFSRALIKITTPYTMGLSATVPRKDRTEWVIKDYLGDILYTAVKRDVDYGVVVRMIDYETDDEAFYSGIQCDPKGTPLYPCMISRICEYNDRTEFVLRVLIERLIEAPEQQILVLGHQRNILAYMFAALEHRRGDVCARMLSATAGCTAEVARAKTAAGVFVGYYLGGMKQAALKANEKCTILLATYQMAAEGLNIPGLTTLFMITSKTDVVQSAGRILRAKNAVAPVMYDFVDSHRVFKNQGRTRLAFYKKENYAVVRVSHSKFAGLATPWRAVHSGSSLASANSKVSKVAATNADDNDDPDNSLYSMCLFAP